MPPARVPSESAVRNPSRWKIIPLDDRVSERRTTASRPAGSASDREMLSNWTGGTTARRSIAVFLLTLAAPPVVAQVGYGYRKGQDPLVLGVKRIVLAARTRDWSGAANEARKLDWQFKELRTDLEIDLTADFRRAVESNSTDELSRAIATLVVHAVRQKFHWNRREALAQYVRAKSRVDAARSYYEEILAIGVQRFDKLEKTRLHTEILAAFDRMLRSVGSAGLFGLRARPPDFDEFLRSERDVLSRLERVYPYAKPPVKRDRANDAGAERAGGGGDTPRADGGRKNERS